MVRQAQKNKGKIGLAHISYCDYASFNYEHNRINVIGVWCLHGFYLTRIIALITL